MDPVEATGAATHPTSPGSQTLGSGANLGDLRTRPTTHKHTQHTNESHYTERVIGGERKKMESKTEKKRDKSAKGVNQETEDLIPETSSEAGSGDD